MDWDVPYQIPCSSKGTVTHSIRTSYKEFEEIRNKQVRNLSHKITLPRYAFARTLRVAFSSSFDSFSPSWSAERKRDATDDTAVPLL